MTTINDLREKVKKAEEAVAKVEKTIERHEVQAEKKLKVVLDNGWNPEDKYCKYDTDEHQNAYWAIVEYQQKLEDIENATKKLNDKKRILQNWKDRLEVAEAKEHKFNTEVPECMKQMKSELIERWDIDDIKRQKRLKEKRNELGYTEFMKRYTNADYNFLYETAESIHEKNVKCAEAFVMDLYNRIYLITGEVTNWKNIHCKGFALNGIVEGKLGKVEVESILAGGYNIQRLHVRTLVHEL